MLYVICYKYNPVDYLWTPDFMVLLIYMYKGHNQQKKPSKSLLVNFNIFIPNSPVNELININSPSKILSVVIEYKIRPV